jgi:hypothetical protein
MIIENNEVRLGLVIVYAVILSLVFGFQSWALSSSTMQTAAEATYTVPECI